MQVSWKEGFVSRGVPAEEVYEALRAIEREKGSVQPAFLVEAARDPQHPAHPLFTWDDQVAARKWREHEAQDVLRAITVTVEVRQPESSKAVDVSVRAFHRVSGGRYAHLETVRQSPNLRQQVLEDAERELRSMEERLRAMALVFGESPMIPALNGLAESRGLLRKGA